MSNISSMRHVPVADGRAVSGLSTADCPHERGHISDSWFYGHRYATATTRRIFCDRCRFQRWLDVEAALALTQGELGVIPQQIARDIADAAKVELLDLAAVQAENRRVGHSLVGFLRVFQRVCPNGSGEYIHLGATTQDVQDTGQALEMRDVLDSLTEVLGDIVRVLVPLAESTAHAPAMGRTHARPALPIGFGIKVASWLDEVLRALERIEAMRPRVLAIQLFGGVGTMAGFRGRGREIVAGCAEKLGLTDPGVGWHTARDRVVEFVGTMAMVAGTLGRIANEVLTLSRPEFGEVEEQWHQGKVGSSTMPHKRNPEACAQVVVMARLTAGLVGPALAAMVGEHERDARTLRIEWACVPDSAHYCLTGAEILRTILNGLTVHEDRLLDNVRAVSDQMATERLMLSIGEHIGKQSAHELVYECSQRAQSTRRPLREVLAEDATVTSCLPEADLDGVFDPTAYLGESEELTRTVVAAARSWIAARDGRGQRGAA